jgi:hypothetical protein
MAFAVGSPILFLLLSDFLQRRGEGEPDSQDSIKDCRGSKLRGWKVRRKHRPDLFPLVEFKRFLRRLYPNNMQVSRVRTS